MSLPVPDFFFFFRSKSIIICRYSSANTVSQTSINAVRLSATVLPITFLWKTPNNLSYENNEHLLTIKSPIHSTSSPVSKKHLIASLGLHTIGSPLILKEVFRITGTPVYWRKLSSNSQNSLFVCREINCGLQVPSTCVTAGMTVLFSSFTLQAVIMYRSL